MNPPVSLADAARTIFADALAACSVEQAFRSKFDAAGLTKAIELCDRVLVIAAGKGASPMLNGLLRAVPIAVTCRLSGVLIAPERPALLPDGIEFFAGGHPLPNAQSFAAAEAALALVQRAVADDGAARAFCFFLISGGASAMMELPLDPAISLEDTIALYRALVHSGASIAEINCVRKHFSAVKGGRLGQLAAAIPNLTVLVSDVPSRQLDALASGPTLPDKSTLADCHRILERYRLLEQFPACVRRFFESPSLPETPKPGAFPANVVTLLCADDLAEAARRRAESLGFTAIVDNGCDDWDYRAAADHLLARMRTLRQQHQRLCLISAGEVTVRLPPEIAERKPRGGRNQHFALYAATRLEPSDRPIAIFSAGSDGIDGNSPFAGAVLDYDGLHASNATLAAAHEALAHFDSSTLLEHIGATVGTGPTGNNLRDLRLLLCE